MYRIFYILFFFLFISCHKDGGNVAVGTPAKVKCKLNISNLDMLVTKADGSVLESSVANLWVLQFNGQTDASVLVKADFYSSPDIGNLNLNLLAGNGQSIYFIANSSDNALFNPVNAPLNTYTLSALKAKTITYATEADNFPANSGKSYLRMSGVYSGDISSAGTSFSINLNRLAAKISFSYTSLASVNPGEAGAIIKIISVALMSVPGNSKFISNPSNEAIAEPATVIDYPATTVGVGQTSGSVVFYMPENIRGQVSGNTSPLQKASTPPVKSTYLEIKGGYYSSGSPSASKIVTYKIYLGKNSITDFNVNSNINHRVNITFKGLYMEDSRISVTPFNSPSNCHIVAPNGVIIIPIGIKGNGSASTIEGGISATHTTASMGILWTTTAGLVTLSDFNSTDQKITITASAGTGNALIAAYSGAGQTGTILWSWHIWVTNYNPDTPSNGTTYTFTNSASVANTFMDRNLGALSTSYSSSTDLNVLYYQFGRKDPFPGGNYTLPTPVAGTQSMNYTIQNPTKFITSASGDWCSTSSNVWWMGIGGNTTTPGAKTIYDPCPSGWRVPAWKNGVSPMAGITTANGTWANNGYFWSSPYNAGFWAAFGYRMHNNGSIASVGSDGWYWTASPISAARGYELFFRNGQVLMADDNERSRGFTVRCTRE